MEDSWFWESEKSPSSVSSKDNDTVPILSCLATTVDQLETNAETNDHSRIFENLRLSLNEKELKIEQLIHENETMKILYEEADNRLEVLDKQHNEVIQRLLELKNQLQVRVSTLENDLTNYDKDHKKLLISNDVLSESLKNITAKYDECVQEKVRLVPHACEFISQALERNTKNEESSQMIEKNENHSRNGSDEFERIDMEKEKLSSSAEVIRLQNELYRINERLSILNDIKDQYDSNVSKLGSTIAERNDLEKEVVRLRTTNDELLEEVRVAREAVEKLEILQKNLDEVNSEKEQNEITLVALQGDDMLLQREYDQLKADNEALISELNLTKNAQNEQIYGLETKCRDLDLNIAHLNDAHQKLLTEHKLCGKRILELQMMHDAMKNSAVNLESNLVQENMLIQKQIIDLQSELNSKSVGTEVHDKISLSDLMFIMAENLGYVPSKTYFSIREYLHAFIQSVNESHRQMKDIESNRDHLMKEFESVSAEKVTLQHDNKTLKADLHHYETEVAELLKNNGILLTELENLKVGKLETISEQNEDNILRLETQLEDITKANLGIQEEYSNILRKIDELEAEKSEFAEKIKDSMNQIEEQNNIIHDLKTLKENLEIEKTNLRTQLDQMRTDDSKLEIQKGFEQKILDQTDKIFQLTKYLQSLKADYTNLVKKMDESDEEKRIITINLMKLEELRTKENKELSKLRESYDLIQDELKKFKIDGQTHLPQNNSINRKEPEHEQILHERQQVFALLQNEKSELIEAVQVKHNENVQYHAKIQELNHIVSTLQQTIVMKNEQLEQCRYIQLKGVEPNVQSIEDEKLTGQIQLSIEKVDTLTKSLQSEKNDKKLLEQQKIDLLEEKHALNRDLTRLRQHLIEMENNHTTEMIEIQNILHATRNEVTMMQEEARKSSTAYTSASIRANQHTETLQAQYAVLQIQKEELSAKLSEAEDRESKNRAALINLQCVLEQFQKGNVIF